MWHPIRKLKTAFHTFIATATELTVAIKHHTVTLHALLESSRRIEQAVTYLHASEKYSRQQAGQPHEF